MMKNHICFYVDKKKRIRFLLKKCQIYFGVMLKKKKGGGDFIKEDNICFEQLKKMIFLVYIYKKILKKIRYVVEHKK